MSQPHDQAPQKLSGNLGTGAIAFMVIAAAAPLTVIGGNAPLAIGQGNGAGAPVGFAIASIITRALRRRVRHHDTTRERSWRLL
ncbi:hypothetical protein [Leucobacter sp. UCMA 4100]|uniref:hypothetical protein n=1 Tax=Leucobacter sp. UCMA 4100 TaxID=2810534 RepID=UPI0022EA9629|nr:hypothetical protein [Leucobacter sp. UCMA 4100]